MKIVKAVETLFENQWISLKRILYEGGSEHGYVYSHETRCDGEIVSVLPYRKERLDYEFLFRSEITPCWNATEYILSTITGGVEEYDPVRDAQRELREEGGYNPPLRDFIYLGECRGSKSSDTIYHLFTIDLTDLEQKEITGDGSGLEAGGTAVWTKLKEIVNIKDPLASVIVMRWAEKEATK